MLSSHRFSAAVLAAIIFFTTADTVEAQWEVRHKFDWAVHCAYFLDSVDRPEIGFVGTGETLFRTTDSGHTWTEVVAIPNMPGARDVYFMDADTGWVATWNGLYKSTDGGLTWRVKRTGVYVSVIYQPTTHKVFANQRAGSGGSQMSSDYGETWHTYGSLVLNGLTHLGGDSLFSSSYSGKFRFSTDGGDTWIDSELGEEAWQPAAAGGRYFAISEANHVLMESKDGGEAWTLLDQFPAKPSGCIRASGNRLFVQLIDGFMISTNLGDTWTNICGPGNTIDTRFYVRGTEIFAGDSLGYLYYNPTATSPDGTSSDPTFESPVHFSADACSGTIKGLDITLLKGCGATLLDASINGSKDFRFQGNYNFPYEFSNRVGFSVLYTPGDDTPDTAFIRVRIRMGTGSVDTTIMLIGKRTRSLTVAATDTLVTLQQEGECRSNTKELVIRNLSCGDIILDSMTQNNTELFVIDYPTFPYTIGPLQTLTIPVHGKAALPGLYDCDAVAYLHIPGQQKQHAFHMTLDVKQKQQPTLRPSDLTISKVCKSFDSSIALYNDLCDTLTITELRFSNQTDFVYPAVTLPYILAPQATMLIPYSVLIPKPGPVVTMATITGSMLGQTVILNTTVRASSRVAMELPSDTIRLVTSPQCPEFDTTLLIENPLCETITVTRLTMTFSPNMTVTGPTAPFDIPALGDFQLNVSSNSLAKQSYSVTVHMSYSLFGRERDTVFEVRVSTPKAFDLDISYPTLNFSRTSTCAPKVRTIPLVNEYCVPLTLEQVEFSSASDAQYSFIYRPTLPRLLAPGEADSIVVQFAPDKLGAAGASIELSFRADRVVHDTFITVAGSGMGSMLTAIDDAALQFGERLTCEPKTMTTVIRNEGCEDVSATLSQSPPSFRLLGPSLPVSIAAGDSVVVTFISDGIVAGNFNERATFRLVNDQNIEQFLDCDLTALCIASPLDVQIAAVRLDSLNPCINTDTTITLSNHSLCDTLLITNAQLDGGQVIDALPVRLAPGETASLTIRITGTGTLATLLLTANGWDTTLSIPYSRRSGKDGNVTLSTVQTDFQTNRCDPVDTRLTISNESCESARIDQLSILPTSGGLSGFHIEPIVALPLFVTPGESLTFDIVYDPSVVGAEQVRLMIDGDVSTNQLLTGRTDEPVATVDLAVETEGSGTIVIGDNTSIAIRFGQTAPSDATLTRISGSLGFDTDLLTVTSLTPANGWTVESQTNASDGLLFVLSHPGTVHAPNELIANATFRSTMAESYASTIMLKDIHLNPQDADYQKCVLRPASIGSDDLTVHYVCGDSLIRSYLAKEILIKNIIIRPQPAFLNKSGSIDVSFELSHSTHTNIELIDATGIVRVQSSTSCTAGSNNVPIEVTTLQSGVYLLRMNVVGFTLHQKVIVIQ